MIRKFKFEDEMHESLQCVPMAVRRKLDRVGLKIGLEQWKALDRGERLAICHIPTDSGEECDALAFFIRGSLFAGAAAIPGRFQQLHEKAFPPCNSISHFLEIGVAVVDGSHPSDRAGDVIKDAVDHVRRDIKLCHSRRSRPTKVVKRPTRKTLWHLRV